MANDVIAAIATPPGRGGIGVVRVSGPSLGAMVQTIAGRQVAPRTAVLAEFTDAGGEVIDQGLVVYFPSPHSYTGEDVFELQGHGGPVVMQRLLQRCLALGARLARPGEFTERAFINDKLDLAQAEGIADLIEASTTEAARCAVRSLRGEFSEAIRQLVDELVQLRMFVEATLDFPEEDVEFIESAGVEGRLAGLRERLDSVIAASRRGSLLREGIHVVIAGEPNVGKSSLLNRLSGEEVAIVTDVPGTTRDAIRQAIEIEGVPLHVVDTAGLREADDPVERIGIERTRRAIQQADLILWVLDATRPDWEASFESMMLELPPGLPRIRVVNKIDLTGAPPAKIRTPDGYDLALSARTGEGIDLLRRAVLEAMGWAVGEEGVYMARARHLEALAKARDHLLKAGLVIAQLELFAEEMREAQVALSTITGEFTADDLLGAIFSRFCIGK